MTMEIFFEDGMAKKNEQIGLFYMQYWYKLVENNLPCKSIISAERFLYFIPNKSLENYVGKWYGKTMSSYFPNNPSHHFLFLIAIARFSIL